MAETPVKSQGPYFSRGKIFFPDPDRDVGDSAVGNWILNPGIELLLIRFASQEAIDLLGKFL